MRFLPAECAECGYDFGEDSVSLSERCAAFSADMTGVLHATSLGELLRRPGPRTWSALEYVAHVGEVLPWYVARIRRVLREVDPRLAGFDWDLAASEGKYRQRGVERVARDLRHACAALAEVALSVTGEDLARAGTGSDGTPRTVEALLARAGHELAHHELDVRRALASSCQGR